MAELVTAPLVWLVEAACVVAEVEQRATLARIERRRRDPWAPWLRPVWIRVDDLAEAIA
jgi:hypothetical protein